MSNKTTREVIIWEELPKDWQVKKLKHISLVQLSNVDKHTVDGQRAVLLCNYVDVYKNEKITSAISFMQATATDEQISRLSIQKNDVLFTKDSETPEDIGVPALVDEDLEGVVCGYHLAMARPDTKLIFGNYLLRVLQSEPIKKYFFIKAAGMTRYGLDKQSISEVPIPLPSLKEQQAIADYLDRETARIDSLIAAKERLLELLAEKRRAVITHAVTRGLNGNVSLRDSGMEWLGEIPSHWEVDIAKRHFDIDLGKMLDANKQRNENGELKPYLRAANVFWEGVWLDDVNQMIFTPDQLKRYRLLKGDLLVTEGGVTVGRSAIWEGELDECYYQNSLNRARPKGTVPTKYFYYWLYFLKMNGYVDIIAEKSTFGHLTNEKLAAIQMTVPPVDEAIEIANSLDKELEKIARVEKKVIEVIALLKERRASLIAAAVSGQLQVY